MGLGGGGWGEGRDYDSGAGESEVAGEFGLMVLEAVDGKDVDCDEMGVLGRGEWGFEGCIGGGIITSRGCRVHDVGVDALVFDGKKVG